MPDPIDLPAWLDEEEREDARTSPDDLGFVNLGDGSDWTFSPGFWVEA